MDSIIFEDPSQLRTRPGRRRPIPPTTRTSVQQAFPDSERRGDPYDGELLLSHARSAPYDAKPDPGDSGRFESESVFPRRTASTVRATSSNALQDEVLYDRENEIGSLAGSRGIVSLNQNFTVNDNVDMATAEDLQSDFDSLFSSPAPDLGSVAVADVLPDIPLTRTVAGAAGDITEGSDEGPGVAPQPDLLVADRQRTMSSLRAAEHPAPSPHHLHFSSSVQATEPGNNDDEPGDGPKAHITVDSVDEVDEVDPVDPVDLSGQWQPLQTPDKASDRLLSVEDWPSWETVSDTGSATDNRPCHERCACDVGRRCPSSRSSRYNGGIGLSPDFALLDVENGEKDTKSDPERVDCVQLRAPRGVTQPRPFTSSPRKPHPSRQAEQLSPPARKQDQPMRPVACRRSLTTLQSAAQGIKPPSRRKRNLTDEDDQLRWGPRRRRFETRPELITHLRNRSTLDSSAGVQGMRVNTEADKHLDIGNGVECGAATRGHITKATTLKSGEVLRYHNPCSLTSVSVQPVTPADAAFFTALVEDPTEVGTLLESPTAWALSCGISPSRPTNVTVKPVTTNLWLVTATIRRSPDLLYDRGRCATSRTGSSLQDTDSGSTYHPSEDEEEARGTKRGHWTSEEDDNLTRWKRLGRSWSWIFDRFPERTEAAIRSRWFVVLLPRETLHKTQSLVL